MSATTLDEYRTNDMAMATFLRVEGHPVQDVQWKFDTCYWVFHSSETLGLDVSRFEGGTATVEPKAYSKKFQETKKEFYHSRPQQPGRRR